MMKALSIRQPWAGLILLGIKPVENRTWATKYRGPLVIHAGKKVDKGMMHRMDYITQKVDSLSLPIIEAMALADVGSWDCLPMFRPGAICGLVEVVDCERGGYTPKRWFDWGGYWWHLKNPQPLAEAIPYKGMLGLFNIPDSIF